MQSEEKGRVAGLPLFANYTYDEKNSISGAGKMAKVRFNSNVPLLLSIEGSRGAISINEAASYLGLGRSSLNRLVYSNELLSIKIGGRRLIPTTELKNYLNKAINEAKEIAEKGRY